MRAPVEDRRLACPDRRGRLSSTLPELFDERLFRELRHPPLLRDAAERFHKRQTHDRVGDAGRDARRARPPVDPAHRVGRRWSQSSLVVMRQKFGFVRCDVDAGRAVALATFACEAKIQCIFYRFISPALRDRLAVEHLEQQSRTASRRMLFLASDLNTWVVGHTLITDGGTLAAGGWYRTPKRWTNQPLLTQYIEEAPALHEARPPSDQ